KPPDPKPQEGGPLPHPADAESTSCSFSASRPQNPPPATRAQPTAYNREDCEGADTVLTLNAAFGWLWITLGMASGAVIGLRFHRSDWLGGYESWPRRLVRLGHISFFGLGILNLLFALTAPPVPFPPRPQPT